MGTHAYTHEDQNNSHKYATWDHVIQREASYPVGSMGACKWPILTARVRPLQSKVSAGRLIETRGGSRL